jgi:hypothetical protein
MARDEADGRRALGFDRRRSTSSVLPPFPVVLHEVAGNLWRAKRGYERRQAAK